MKKGSGSVHNWNNCTALFLETAIALHWAAEALYVRHPFVMENIKRWAVKGQDLTLLIIFTASFRASFCETEPLSLSALSGEGHNDY